MQKKLLYFVAFVWIIGMIVLLLNIDRKSSEEVIVSAFVDGDYINSESSIEAVVDYGNSYLNDEDKKELLSKIAKKIGLNSEYDYLLERNSTGEEASIYKEAKFATTSIKLVSIENEVESNVIELEQYIIININFHQSVDNVLAYKKLIDDVFNEMKLKAEITFNLVGSYDGKISTEKKELIVDQLLGNIDAQIVSENKDQNMYDIYAYTSLIDKYITVEKKKVNVNIAISYDETAHKSKIMLSSPIINGDY